MNRVFIWNERASTSVGPFDLETFLNLLEEGAVNADTLVATDEEDAWTQASEHPVTAASIGLERVVARPRTAARTRSMAPFSPSLVRSSTSNDEATEKVVHSLYDPDYELDILELNTGNRRRLRDYAILAGGLNALLLIGALSFSLNPMSAAVLLTFFVGGNVGLSWLFGVVMGS